MISIAETKIKWHNGIMRDDLVNITLYDVPANLFNAETLAEVGSVIMLGEDRIDSFVLNGDNILPPPNLGSDIEQILLGMRLMWCSFTLRIGFKRNVIYPVRKRLLEKFEVLWYSNRKEVESMGGKAAIVGGETYPEWIIVENEKHIFFGVMPDTQMIRGRLAMVTAGDYIYKCCLYKKNDPRINLGR